MISYKFQNILNYRYTYLFLTLIIAFIGYQVRFIQDDAFISFRYAENFANGHGLIWNIGEPPIEGYTNFLWVLLLAIGAYVGIELISWSMMLSIFFGIGTILVTYHLALRVRGDRKWALLAILLLGSNFTFLAYMTGGLETQLITFLIILSLFLADVSVTHKRNNESLLIFQSFVFSLCILTRMDSLLCVVPIFLYMIWEYHRISVGNRDIIINSLLLIIPGSIVTTSWLIFKVYYYGDILPNTFYVKSQLAFIGGLRFALTFISEYSFFLFIPFFYFFRYRLYSSGLKILLIVLIILWSAYIMKEGGDFMEFRFFVPILPLFSILFAIIIRQMNDIRFQTAAVSLVLFSSFTHAIFFEERGGIESTRSLNRHIYDKDINWKGIGEKLGDLFYDDKADLVKIAISPAGAIPYYSKLYTIDMLGLNDKWIARNGIYLGTRPGHSKFTTLDYLIKSDVNVVIGHPQVKPIGYPVDSDPLRFFNKKVDISNLPESSKILEIPIDKEYNLEVLYIKEHPIIENFLKDYAISPVPIEITKLGAVHPDL